MKVLVLLLLLTVSIYADPIIDLGVLTPGSDNVMELEIPLWIHSRENEVHYVRYEWRSDNFTTPPIWLKTEDGKVVRGEVVEVPVEKHDTSYPLYLSSDAFAPPGTYQFTICTYSINPNSGSEYPHSRQYFTYAFTILPELLIEQTDLWPPPETGQPWESSTVSKHTLRIKSRDPWELSIQGLKVVDGLHAVVFDKYGNVLSQPKIVPVTHDKQWVCEGGPTVDMPDNEMVFTVVLYIEDYTVVPAGQAELQVYLEVRSFRQKSALLSVPD
ncbi:MAG TPA: hypothetical protein PLN81_05030 [Bacillota bacterium]|jgi:hypothetical protein|nr:hypothetical protein [Bacillota bacterium]HOJ47186.1 hypothetical protein [Bacillota bacterium]HOL13393.1 hypothetical protein [Bacillota bacterium]HOP54003.1 hypothetical protein [Bacillota bacterium]HPQ09796.1 hypothetical protein [Bacillota bacterium]